jgi:hypothetical protein
MVMACCSDVPTLETLGAVDILHQHVPELKIRVINVASTATICRRSRAGAGDAREGPRRRARPPKVTMFRSCVFGSSVRMLLARR